MEAFTLFYLFHGSLFSPRHAKFLNFCSKKLKSDLSGIQCQLHSVEKKLVYIKCFSINVPQGAGLAPDANVCD